MVGFGQSQARVERLLTLSWILGRRQPVTLAELRDRYGLYADGDEDSARRKFERDKVDLRALGMDIETALLDQSTGYRIRRSSVQRTRVTWTDEELDTLAVLAATVGDAATGTALARLAAPSGEFPAEGAGATVEVDIDVPPTIAEAAATGRTVSFRYRDAEGAETDRVIEPWQIRERGGQAYVTGFDRGAGASRNFRLDRVVGEPAIGDDATHDQPDGPLDPLYPDEHVDVVADVPATRTHEVHDIAGEVVDEDDDRLRVRFEGRRPEAMLGWALRFDAAILSPDELAREARSRLERLVERHDRPPGAVEWPKTPRARHATMTADRLKRMLTLPAWLGERSGVTLEEAAQAFGCTVDEIEAELELLELIDIPGIGSVVETERHDDGQIVYHRFVQEPTVELSPTDALRLLLLVDAGSLVLTPAEAPALASIAERLHAIVPASVRAEVHGADHPDLESLRQARAEGRVVRFDYRGRKDHAWRRRTVAPERIVIANRAVYLTGFDLEANGARHFRVDRLSDVEVAGDRPNIAAEAMPPAYVPVGPEVEVLLRLTTKATWILSHVAPSASEPTADGGAIALVGTDAVEWLLDHVMAAGGEAEVIVPATVRAQVAERARAALTTYER